MKLKPGIYFIVIAVIIIALGLLYYRNSSKESDQTVSQVSSTDGSRNPAPPEFVGSHACAECHKAEYELWRGSDHDHAMEEANEKTVLGDFNDTEFTYFDVTSRFYRKDGKYMVLTDGPDGELKEYEIKYTFGVYPLQQYLIEFPGGRLQALGIAWDTRDESEGGQRWFHLYPGEEIKHGDALHWTGINQNWNYMCAECHSTNLKKNYDSVSDTYETTWSEINVSCESCHGPGSAHIEWAERKDRDNGPGKGLLVNFDERKGATWTIDPETVNAKRSKQKHSDKEIETCARCHSRRSVIWEDYRHGQPLMNTHIPVLIEDGYYYPDGQILDEVYVYGSFLQSKMYAKGVTCSDCHNPHSLKLYKEGNELCGTCHMASKYDSPSHHHHKTDSAGAECTGCHMPSKNYMVVDPRLDHSIRIPRPDQSIKLGTPNACNNCHDDKDAEWASSVVHEWYGDKVLSYNDYADAFYSSRNGMPNSERLLSELAVNGSAPGIVRATALSELGGYLSPESIGAVKEGLNDPDPMVRAAAIGSLQALGIPQRLELLFNLLDDPVRGVRIEAARMLAPAINNVAQPDQKNALETGVNEYIKTQELNLDRPEANLNLGNLYTDTGEIDKAEESYKRSISLDPGSIQGYVNLADLYRVEGRDDLGEEVLEEALEADGSSADVHHALGLLLVRDKRLDEAVYHLGESSRLDPDNPRYAYVYAVSLNSTGRTSEAIDVLERAVKRHPYNKEILIALMTFNSDLGKTDAAARCYEKYKEYYPDDPNIGILGEQLIR